MSRPRNEPVQALKARRDAALTRLVEGVPFIRFLGVRFERMGDELTARLVFSDKIIGGVTGAFLEIAAQMELAWHGVWARMEAGGPQAEAIERGEFPPMPKTVDFTVDYLRSGLPRDAYARAVINRAGRRYASVSVEAWQDQRGRPFAAATGHFVMPELSGGGEAP